MGAVALTLKLIYSHCLIRFHISSENNDFGFNSSCLFLGHEISKNGISPPSDRLKAVSEYPVPKTTKQLKRYLGLMNWFKKYISGYSAKAHCLYQLLRKGVKFVWKDEHKAAFDILKTSLLNSEALAFPQYDLPFYLGVDTSSQGTGYMLYQKHPSNSGDETVRVVRFGSKSLSHYQISYGPTKLELLGVVTSILDCASYLRGRKFYVDCDHQALKPLFQQYMKDGLLFYKNLTLRFHTNRRRP